MTLKRAESSKLAQGYFWIKLVAILQKLSSYNMASERGEVDIIGKYFFFLKES